MWPPERCGQCSGSIRGRLSNNEPSLRTRADSASFVQDQTLERTWAGGQQLLPQQLQIADHQGVISLHVWAGITITYRTSFTFLERYVNAERYGTLLHDHLMPFIHQTFNGPEHIVFCRMLMPHLTELRWWSRWSGRWVWEVFDGPITRHEPYWTCLEPNEA